MLSITFRTVFEVVTTTSDVFHFLILQAWLTCIDTTAKSYHYFVKQHQWWNVTSSSIGDTETFPFDPTLNIHAAIHFIITFIEFIDDFVV